VLGCSVFTTPRLLAIVVVAVASSSGTSRSSIEYEASAGWNVGDEGYSLKQRFSPPVIANFGGDFSRHGALCPDPGTHDYLCMRAGSEAALVGPPGGGGLLTLRAEARLTRHDGVGLGNEEIVYGEARMSVFGIGTVAVPDSGFVVFNFGLSGTVSASASSAALAAQANGVATLYADQAYGIQCFGYPCPGIPLRFDKGDPHASFKFDGFLIDLRADVRDKPPAGFAGWDDEMIADFHDTLVLLSIEVQDDNHQTVPGASVFVESYDNMGTPLPISNEPPPPPVITTTTTNQSQTTTTILPGTETTTSTTTVFSIATTTTTSVPPGTCDLDAPTFTSIGCRLDGLLARITSDASLGDYQQKLPPSLAGAAARLHEAADSCGSGDAKRAGKKIKNTAHGLVQYGHRLSGRRAHRRLPATLRKELVARGNAIRADVTTLRRALRCPEDAPAQPR
jgi:hypothetical protein